MNDNPFLAALDALGHDTMPPEIDRPRRDVVPVVEEDLAPRVDALLAGFGVSAGGVQLTVDDIITRLLDARGLHGRAGGVRWGVATLYADAVQARLIRYVADELTDELSAATDGNVTGLRIKVARPR